MSVTQKKSTLRRTVSDLLLSACALSILVTILMVIDPRVREEVSARMDAQRAASDVSATTGQIRRMLVATSGVVKDQSETHGPLMTMLVVGTVLTVIMFRT